MISKNRKSKRKTLLRFRVSAEEENMIKTKTEQIDIISMSAYLSKMAIDGYVINLEMPELQEMISLLRSSSNNHNQIAIHINTTGRIYDKNMEEILRWQKKLWKCANETLKKLAAIA